MQRKCQQLWGNILQDSEKIAVRLGFSVDISKVFKGFWVALLLAADEEGEE